MNDFYSFDENLYVARNRFLALADVSYYYEVALQCITLNCGSAQPTVDLQYLVIPGRDLYAISLQEFDTDPYVFVGANSKLASYYITIFAAVIKYYFYYRYMGSQLLIVFVSDAMCATDVDFTVVPTGNLGLSNKGGIVCKIRARDSVICIIGCHLSASREYSAVQRRNSDLLRILTGAAVSGSDNAQLALWRKLQTFYAYLEGDSFYVQQLRYVPEALADCDCVFLLGDLNFRVQTALTDESVALRLESDSGNTESIKELLYCDELNAQKSFFTGKSEFPVFGYRYTAYFNNDYIEVCGCFRYFNEAYISFPPTYCMVPRSEHYYVTAEKHRMPSYTDRILWLQICPDVLIACEAYERGAYMESDHRPVSLNGRMRIRTIDKSMERDLIENAQKSARETLAGLTPSFDAYLLDSDIEAKPLQIAVARAIIKNKHDTQVIRIAVAAQHPFALHHTLELCIEPLSTAEVSIALLVDPTAFDSVTSFRAAVAGERRCCEVTFYHLRAGVIYQQYKLEFNCSFSGIDQFCEEISNEAFGGFYRDVYTALAGGYTLRTRDQALDSIGSLAPWHATRCALMLCAIIKSNGAHVLDAAAAMLHEYERYKNKKLALYILDQMALPTRNQVVCVFTLLRLSVSVRALFSRAFGRYWAVLDFVFSYLYK